MTRKKRYVSHSSISDYTLCPRKYRLKRVDRIRSVDLKSAFFFGSAIDAAVEAIFLRKKKDLTEEEAKLVERDYLNVFQEQLNKAKHPITYEEVQVAKNPNVSYSKADYQPELLGDESLSDIRDFALKLEFDTPDLEDMQELLVEVMESKSKDEDIKVLQNYINWNCLLEKGTLILSEVYNWCEENVKETLSVQREIRVEDENDVLVGWNDLEVVLKNNKHVLVDFKTSSIKYDSNDANESQQLTIYGEMLGLDDVAFLVFEKNIRKREPRVRWQFIEGKLTEEQKYKTFNDIEEALEGIDNENFPKNLKGCYRYGKCEYFDFCKSKNMKGLVKVEKK